MRCPTCTEPAPWFDWRAWKTGTRLLFRCPECGTLLRHVRRRSGVALFVWIFTVHPPVVYSLVRSGVSPVAGSIWIGVSTSVFLVLAMALLDRFEIVGDPPGGWRGP